MAYFQWGDDLTVGNELIDKDHRRLIDLVNELHTATQHGEGRIVVGKILDELLGYTRDHFHREELHMERIRYNRIDLHRIEHAKILKELLVLKEQFESGNVTVAAKVSALLRDWLSVHIMHSDKAFANVMNAEEKRSGYINARVIR